ncbi:homeobox-leucine zipper protein ATHB-12-like isoform X1 [Punica granatum]|uniref:Homeobox-leucine zipper protein n=1 Tax=Punica granatum TaxID=22663 RepID=A0A6P8DGE9_PUNGR|nr:homeobox-leucine zipper protein ATHB-12-like isoform X1 [Punica granatum]
MLPRKHQAFTATSLNIKTTSSSSSNLLMHQVQNKRNTDKTKRRFREDQVKSLEGTFESESRPDSCLKHQLADRLELEPRQVAIWFQNKRARLKNKQIEWEYSRLKTKYDDLTSSFESLKREHELLLVQLQKLKSNHRKAKGSAHTQAEDHAKESQTKPGYVAGCRHNARTVQSGDDCGIAETVPEKFTLEHVEEMGQDSFPSSGSWYDPGYFLDESSYGPKWWELWS